MNVNRHLSDAFCGRWQIECRSQLSSSTSTLPLPLALPVRCSADVVAAVCHSRDRNASSIRQQGAGKRLLTGMGEGGSQTMRAAARLIGRQHVCCCVVLLLRRVAVAIHAQLTCLTAVGIVVGCMPHACLLGLLHLRPACHLHNLYISGALTHTHTLSNTCSNLCALGLQRS